MESTQEAKVKQQRFAQNKGSVTLEYSTATYTGSEIKPKVTSFIDEYGNSLKEGVDYRILYENNINPEQQR
ncbi:MAG: hypothetical protein Q4B59_03875 [Lachnospiraceae bacterium]|nr:hypothetical protein [Lachnospiraceae bacterium]